MKYIRTKDGHYGWIMTEEKRQELIACAKGDYGYIKFDIPIEKSADTIEELVDEKVIIWKDKNYIPTLARGVYLPKVRMADVEVIYGALWTDKGLIYVAKMNDEGKLELI